MALLQTSQVSGRGYLVLIAKHDQKFASVASSPFHCTRQSIVVRLAATHLQSLQKQLLISSLQPWILC